MYNHAALQHGYKIVEDYVRLRPTMSDVVTKLYKERKTMYRVNKVDPIKLICDFRPCSKRIVTRLEVVLSNCNHVQSLQVYHYGGQIRVK